MQKGEIQPEHLQESHSEVQDREDGSVPWQIRQIEGEDLPFIYATWLNSLQSDSRLGKSVRRSIFIPEQLKIIDSILENDATHILVACSREDPSVIFGYAVSEPDQLHYVYVKEDFRFLGIAYSLVFNQPIPSFYTHQTLMGKKVLQHLNLDIHYNPFLLNRRGLL